MYHIFAAFSAALLSVVVASAASGQMLACTESESVDDYRGVRVGVRSDAPPFSGSTDDGETFDGYMVELCAEFLQEVIGPNFCAVEVKLGKLDAGAAGGRDRFEALGSGEIDMLCGATTATLALSHRFRTSLTVFLSASAFLHVPPRADATTIRIGYRVGSTSDPRRMADQPVAQDEETTIRNAILGRLDAPGADVEFVPIAAHDAAIGCLTGSVGCSEGRIDAYVGDRPILRAILDRAREARKESTGDAARGDNTADDVMLDGTALVLQPYSVLFPKEPRATNLDLRDLGFRFDRFLVTQKFSTQRQRGGSNFLAFRRQLLRHFGSEVDVSYLRLAEMQGWIPVGHLD